jgi:ribosomal protein L37AE/L43A
MNGMYGALAFQAFPRRRAPGQKAWTALENADLQKITSDIRKRSEQICEWCGTAWNHRESRNIELSLCDACNERFPDPPYPVTTTGFTRAGQTRSAVGLLSPSVPPPPCRGALFTLGWGIRA